MSAYLGVSGCLDYYSNARMCMYLVELYASSLRQTVRLVTVDAVESLRARGNELHIATAETALGEEPASIGYARE